MASNPNRSHEQPLSRYDTRDWWELVIILACLPGLNLTKGLPECEPLADDLVAPRSPSTEPSGTNCGESLLVEVGSRASRLR